MQKKEEEINEKCFERNFNELNEEFSNNNNNRMTNNEEAKALAEQIDNFASSKINKKKEKRITTLVLVEVIPILQGDILIKLITLMIKEITLIL